MTKNYALDPYRREHGVLIPPILGEYTMHEVYKPPAGVSVSTTMDAIGMQAFKVPKDWYKYFMSEHEYVTNLRGIKLYDTPRQAMTEALRAKLLKTGAVRCTVTNDTKPMILSGYYLQGRNNPQYPEVRWVIVLADDVSREIAELFGTNLMDYPTKDISYFELSAHKDEVLIADVESI